MNQVQYPRRPSVSWQFPCSLFPGQWGLNILNLERWPSVCQVATAADRNRHLGHDCVSLRAKASGPWSKGRADSSYCVRPVRGIRLESGVKLQASRLDARVQSTRPSVQLEVLVDVVGRRSPTRRRVIDDYIMARPQVTRNVPHPIVIHPKIPQDDPSQTMRRVLLFELDETAGKADKQTSDAPQRIRRRIPLRAAVFQVSLLF